MVIVKFWGGVGNQLFIYSLYRELEFKGLKVKADISSYDNVDIRDFVLDKLGITLDYVDESDYFKIQKSVKNKIQWLKNQIRRRDYKYFNSYQEKGKTFDESVLNADNTCVMGYWQCPEYFSDVEEDIKESIKFPQFPHFNSLISEIKANNSVSVHVRLTDYMIEVNKGLGSVCSINYYKNAIEEVINTVKDPVFYVFSDDITLAKKMLSKISGFAPVYIEPHAALEDLYLMSNCRHHIMANSSFSWWGAELSEYEGSVVVVPEVWDVNRPEWDIYKPEWIKVRIL